MSLLTQGLNYRSACDNYGTYLQYLCLTGAQCIAFVVEMFVDPLQNYKITLTLLLFGVCVCVCVCVCLSLSLAFYVISAMGLAPEIN